MTEMAKKIKGNRKGFIFSFDAVFAILIVFFLIALIFNNILKEPAMPPIQMQRQGMDVLAVLENLNRFYNSSTTFAETSDSYCMRLEMYNGTSSVIDATFVKAGCPSADSDERVVWRTATFGNRFKTAKLAIWVKR
jgi:hypothetical protein